MQCFGKYREGTAGCYLCKDEKECIKYSEQSDDDAECQCDCMLCDNWSVCKEEKSK